MIITFLSFFALIFSIILLANLVHMRIEGQKQSFLTYAYPIAVVVITVYTLTGGV
jgi:hypothetical protein